MVVDEIVLGLGVHLYLSERLFQWVSVQGSLILDRCLAFAKDRSAFQSGLSLTMK